MVSQNDQWCFHLGGTMSTQAANDFGLQRRFVNTVAAAQQVLQRQWSRQAAKFSTSPSPLLSLIYGVMINIRIPAGLLEQGVSGRGLGVLAVFRHFTPRSLLKVLKNAETFQLRHKVNVQIATKSLCDERTSVGPDWLRLSS
jgi:hypothetical protein